MPTMVPGLSESTLLDADVGALLSFSDVAETTSPS
jgi:hypothetical protein